MPRSLRPESADAQTMSAACDHIRVSGRRSFLVACVLSVAVPLALPAPAKAEPAGGQWDPSLPRALSAGAPGDPVAIANASLQASALAAQTTMDLGRKFLSSLGVVSPSASPAPSLSGGRVYGKQAIEYVIRRAGSQIGVPYSWGGGSLTGPSRGIDSGARGSDSTVPASRVTHSPVSALGCPGIPAISTTLDERCPCRKRSVATCCSGVPAGVNTKRFTLAVAR